MCRGQKLDYTLRWKKRDGHQSIALIIFWDSPWDGRAMATVGGCSQWTHCCTSPTYLQNGETSKGSTSRYFYRWLVCFCPFFFDTKHDETLKKRTHSSGWPTSPQPSGSWQRRKLLKWSIWRQKLPMLVPWCWDLCLHHWEGHKKVMT